MIPLEDHIIESIQSHSKSEYPLESCGLVIIKQGKQRYIPAKNVSEAKEISFTIAAEDFARAEDAGEIIRLCHSHCNMPAVPSEADLVSCETSGVPWLIVNQPTGAIYEWSPTGYSAPLIGRTFAHGVLDCYTLIRDYFRIECGIEIPNFRRKRQWWLRGEDMYVDNFEQAGFFEVDKIQQHDVLLMQIGSPVINHGAVYIGNNQIIQHCTNRLSSRDVYGGGWQRAVRKIVRHKNYA